MAGDVNTRKAVPSAYNIISSNRSIGYNMEAAVADIIDNSISAKATDIEIFAPDSSTPVLYIFDNGTGMDQSELDNAMTFGGLVVNCNEQRAKDDLGRFGMGLKTASLSQCRKLEVITKKNNKIIGGCWDLDYLKSHDSWEYQVIPEEQCLLKIEGHSLYNLEHGTAVIWSHFDRLKQSADNSLTAFDYNLSQTVAKLELVFHRYLSGEPGLNKINISYNKIKLYPNNPFNTKGIDVSKAKIIPFKEGNVSVLSHKLLHPSKYDSTEFDRLQLNSTLLETQGFYIYRNKRLIDYGTWFGLAPKLEKTKLSRIQIDFPNTLDSIWSLDIKKSRAIPPQKIRSELKKIMISNGTKSSETYRTRKVRNSLDLPYWDKKVDSTGSVTYGINLEHPLVSHFNDSLNEQQSKEFKLLLTNFAKFFPYAQLELEYQNDEVRVGDSAEFDKEQLRQFYCLLKAAGMKFDQILACYPGNEDMLREIEKEN